MLIPIRRQTENFGYLLSDRVETVTITEHDYEIMRENPKYAFLSGTLVGGFLVFLAMAIYLGL